MPSVLLTAPAGEPLSLADIKAFLRIEHGDDDGVIDALIAGARIHVEARTRRALMTQTWRLSRDVWPASGVLPLLPAPVRELVAVRVFTAAGAQSVDTATFDIDTVSAPALLTWTRGALPQPGRPFGGIEIDVAAGYGHDPDDVPQPLRHAIRLLVAHWYEHRALIAASGEVASVPASVAGLLAPYRVLSL
jgi:uncharacterized phiE125 gp8 family phage protein